MQRYAITDRSLLPPHPGGWQAALLAQVAAWVRGGVDWVQLREKDLPPATLIPLVRDLAALLRPPESNTRFVVNGLTPELARANGAHGIHLRGGATEAEVQAAAVFGGEVSVSCHTLAEVAAARAGGASAILWGPVFEKVVGSAPQRHGTGLASLQAACASAAPVPVFALGGVSLENASACLAAGAAGVAGIRLFHGETWRSLE